MKKTLIYLVMMMLVLPTSIMAAYMGAEKAQAAELTIADHVVISEVQLAGSLSTTDEFVELYNPTDEKVELTGFSLVKMTATGTKSNLVHDVNMAIESQSYLLFAGNGYAGVSDAKFASGITIADNNTVALVNGEETIDEIGFGTAQNFEGASISNPAKGQSVERKFDNNIGNIIDTDNNSEDFYLQLKPNPQGSNTNSLFAGISAKTVLSLDESSKTTVKMGDKIDATVKVDYPEELISQVDSDYKVDAFIAVDKEIAVGTTLDLYYQGSKLGTYTFSASTPFITVPEYPGIKGLWLSDLIKGIDKDLLTRTPLNAEVDSSWRFVLSGMTEGKYNLVFMNVTSKDFLDDSSGAYFFNVLAVPLVVDGSVNTPGGLIAAKKGNQITLSWKEVTNDLSGIDGYNIYSSADDFTAPINVKLIAGNSYVASDLLDGKYQYEITALDKVGNESAKSAPSNEVIIDNSKPVAAIITATSVSDQSGRFVKVEWKGVGGYVERYDIYVNGVLSSGNSVIVGDGTDDANIAYVKSIKILADGNYDVYIKTSKGENSAFSNNANVHFETVAPVITNTNTVPPVQSVETSPVVPTKAKAAVNPQPSTPQQVQTPSDNNGVIKGDEKKDESASATNWTPWIILFILIVFAGAATGGYFYWFAGKEEGASQEGASAVKSEKKEKVSVTVRPKQKPNKKSKRW